jgi:hypothetical protein
MTDQNEVRTTLGCKEKRDEDSFLETMTWIMAGMFVALLLVTITPKSFTPLKRTADVPTLNISSYDTDEKEEFERALRNQDVGARQ